MESSHGVVINMLDCVESLNSTYAITFTFGLMPLGKVDIPLNKESKLVLNKHNNLYAYSLAGQKNDGYY